MSLTTLNISDDLSVSGNIFLNSTDISNVLKIHFSDGTTLSTATGGGGGDFEVTKNFNISNFDIINVSNLRFGDGSVISSGSSLTISGNTFFNNKLAIGGGITADNELTLSGILQFTNNNYASNNEKYGLYSFDNQLQLNPRTSTGAWRNINSFVMDSSGRIGIGQNPPTKTLDLNGTFNMTNGTRSGTHTTTYPFYATANIGADSDGFQFGHINGTTGIGIGSEGIYMAGSTANLPMAIVTKGIGGILLKPGGTAVGTFTTTGLGL
jgi:hypothetical protein